MSDYSEYFEELRDVTSKPLIMSNNNANFCFFGRFSIPTYAHHMSGMLFVEYDTNYDVRHFILFLSNLNTVIFLLLRIIELKQQ